MELSRRSMLKAKAAAVAATAAGIGLPAEAANVPAGEDLALKWSKAPCRFCGTGCGVMVAVKEGKGVATHGDMQAEVNRGLNCVKGYNAYPVGSASLYILRPGAFPPGVTTRWHLTFRARWSSSRTASCRRKTARATS